MTMDRVLDRRSFLLGAAGVALAACTRSNGSAATSTPSIPPQAAPPSQAAVTAACGSSAPAAPLWERGMERGLVVGSSAATWQLSDPEYRAVFQRQAGILFTEDDLLWWRLKPKPSSPLDFTYGDKIVDFADRQGMLVFGAHLVWDEGFGDGWTDDDLWGMDHDAAEHLIHSTVDTVVRRYAGRVAAWSVVNEAVDANGVRTDVPWYSTIGPNYIADAFRTANAADPNALLTYNDYGYETDADGSAADKRAATLDMLDGLLADGVPVHALGVQAHLHAARFAKEFDGEAYAAFLSAVAERGLKILITELDVLDDGLPADAAKRDEAVADVYGAYLDAALQQPDIVALMTFGLSDRYTWLQEDYPRDDGAPRRPLPFDDGMGPKPALTALATSLDGAADRQPYWAPPRCD